MSGGFERTCLLASMARRLRAVMDDASVSNVYRA